MLESIEYMCEDYYFFAKCQTASDVANAIERVKIDDLKKVAAELAWLYIQNRIKMEKSKVVEISENGITFDTGVTLQSYHEQDCCEWHWIDWASVTLEDFEDCIFNLANENFFERVPDYGIRLIPNNNYPISIPGYGDNNGYYTDNLSIILKNSDGKIIKQFDITECQKIKD